MMVKKTDTNSQPEIESWVLIGGVESGKTFFLDSVLSVAASETRIKGEKTGIANFDFYQSAESREYISAVRRERIQKAVPNSTSGVVRELMFNVKLVLYDDANNENAAHVSPIKILMIDGPGGAIISSTGEMPTKGGEADELRQKYLEHAANATGIIFCLPSSCKDNDQSLNPHEFYDIINILEQTMAGTMKNLRKIAVCITKYEARFFDHGNKAEEIAQQEQSIYDAMREIDGGSSLIERLTDAAASDAEHPIEVNIFPISAYGFIGDTGFANYEKVTRLPMVSTYAPPKEVGSYKVQLYPKKFSDDLVRKLWKPFNVAAPLAYLAGADPKGMIHLPISAFINKTEKGKNGAL